MAVVVGLEGALRAWRAWPPGPASGRVVSLLTLAVGVTIAGGLGLLVGGAQPRELLHLLYAILAFGTLPLAVSMTRDARPRRQGLATVIGALVALILIARLFGTG